jgi:chemotaxis protein methyltransferase WspC
MAMTLLDAGIPAAGFHVDAIDISANSLALARRAIYGRNSFRNAEVTFRGRYFSAAEASWQLGDAVRRQVQFRQDNLFAAGFLPGVSLYDVIFCRNVLIYFDRAGQDHVIHILRRLLTPTGLLFVAPSETNVISEHGFVSAKFPMAFAFRKDIAPGSVTRPAVVPATLPIPRPRAAAVVRNEAMEIAQTAQEGTLEQAMALANSGHRVDAAKLCELHVKTWGPSAPAYNLIALLRAGGGNAVAAIANYRKSLYLDPNNHEALTHLALLLQKRGDVSGANTLRARARRIQSAQQREKPT